MEDIFAVIQANKEKAKAGSAPKEGVPVQEQSLNDYQEAYESEDRVKNRVPQRDGSGGNTNPKKPAPNPNGSFAGELDADPEKQKQNEENEYSESVWGPGGKEPLETDADSWSPDYTANGFFAESGTSVMRGVGKHIIKGTGDMIQVLGAAIPGITVAEGNMLSRTLQESGEEFASKFKSLMPEEFNSENIGWSAIASPKFWSTQMAEMVPQLAEFIFISKGGSAALRAGTGAIARKMAGKGILKGATKTAGGVATPFTGKGVIGKLYTDVGLTSLGSGLTGAVGGGVTGNIFSGMLNAAELVNSNKEAVDANGQRLYSDEQLGEMASNSMINNAAWVGVDMLSWGMTYGGGWKALKGMNLTGKVAKKLPTVSQQLKTASTMFGKYSLAPAFGGIGKVAGMSAIEGIEETFQETFEEWAKMKAKAEVTGEGDDSLWNPDGFMDFYNSKENKHTKVLSFALGALGGAAGNITSVINKKADENYKLYDATKNFNEIVKKQGSESEMKWQQYHTVDTLARIIAHGKEDQYGDFSQGLVDNENINEEEKKELDTMFAEMQEVSAQASRLNVKGVHALLHNKAQEMFAVKQIDEFKLLAQANIADLKAMNVDTKEQEESVQKRIQQEVTLFETRMKAASLIVASAQQNQQNLKLGKKADPLDIRITYDQYGNEVVESGIASNKYDDYTSKDEFNKDGSVKAKKVEKPEKASVLTLSNLGNKAKEIYKKSVGSITGVDPNEKELVKAEQKAEALTEEELENQPDLDTEAEAEVEATNKEAIDDVFDDVTESETEVISDEVFEQFKSGVLDRGLADSIADKIIKKEPLSQREKVIKTKYAKDIRSRIAKKMLGVDTNEKVSTEADDKLGIDEAVSNDVKKKSSTNPEVNEDDDKEDEVEDETLSEDEKKFVEAELESGKLTPEQRKAIEEEFDVTIKDSKRKTGSPFNVKANQNTKEGRKKKTEAQARLRKSTVGKSIEETNKENEAKAKKEWNFDKTKTEGSEDLIGLDKRTEDALGTNVRLLNLMDFQTSRGFIHRVIKRNNTNQEISQNELDNYLNLYTTYNLKGPSEVMAMVVVNHHLKRMFPDTMKNPAQVIAVRNLYEAVGSQGVAHTLMATMYIDTKVWNQNKYFMHELSHVYYSLSEDEPETQALLNAAMKNKTRVAEIRAKYDDQTLYQHKNGDYFTKGQMAKDTKLSPEDLADFIRTHVEAGVLKTLPLSQQRYIKDELFADYLETPLSDKYDKMFKPVDEIKRQATTKMWWGMLRKRGEIIKDDNIDTLLRQVDVDEREGNEPKEAFLFNRLRAITKGVEMNLHGMDARADEVNEEKAAAIKQFAKDKAEQMKYEPVLMSTEQEQKDRDDALDAYEDGLEDNGDPYYNNKEFDQAIKSTTRILKRFGIAYNKALRKQYIIDRKGKKLDLTKQRVFDEDGFQSIMFNLATEIQTPDEFGVDIENSEIKEIQSFNRFLDKVHPNQKKVLLSSMHFILSNSKHIVGMRNNISAKNEHFLESSFSQKETTKSQNILSRLKAWHAIKDNNPEGDYAYDMDPGKWQEFQSAVYAIYAGKETAEDYKTVVDALTNYNTDKLWESGVITFRGNTMPLETLISGFIKKKLLFNKNSNGEHIPGKGLFYANAKPLIDALLDTNRKFTPLSAVFNAEENMTPLRIINNNMTKEMDNMINFLHGKDGVKPDKEAFFKRYSHTAHKQINQNILGKRYVPNQLLDQIYDNFQKGMLPTITQYHGVKDLSNKNGNVFENSSSTEQLIEDMLMFLNTSRNKSGTTRNKSYLGNMGAFSDSPRKFFMNMKLIKYEDVFEGTSVDGRTFSTKAKGNIINNLMNLHDQFYDDHIANNKKAFKEEFNKSIDRSIEMFNSQGPVLSKIQNLKKYYTGTTLNPDGQKMVAEFTINSMVNGYNIADMFVPGVTGKNISKRFKANSSPVISVKNENFKIEPIPVADTIEGNSISGTDGGMYISEKSAEKLRQLGQLVFDVNHGFKLLNSSIEKDNPQFQGKLAYLKGYTTIVVDKSHPYHKILEAREQKYEAWFKKKFPGKEISMDLNDGSFNHMAIIVPQSADKSNFYPKKFINEDKDGTLSYTEDGKNFTAEALSQNIDEAMKHYDELFYDKEGEFVGVDSYNFGPQQLMDKVVKRSGTPVQMINSIIVNAALNGSMDIAVAIQQHISNQKQQNLMALLEEVNKEGSIENYKKLIMGSLNQEDMNQAQRVLLMDDASLMLPYVNEIVTNQLVKSIRREGNKLSTEGTYAHQKPDTGYKLGEATGGKNLSGYTENTDGSLEPGEMVAPAHMRNQIRKRQVFTHKTEFGKASIKANKANHLRDGKPQDQTMDDMNALSYGAISHAANVLKISKKEAEQHVRKMYNKEGIHIGYYVKGETVIASRVPGHGPSSTGVFEIVDFDNGEGNQVMISHKFNDIMGADNDGDALFIQMKGDEKKYSEWNKAFDLMTKYWTSKEMASQVQVKMDFKKKVEDDIKKINEVFSATESYRFPFSPEARMADYDNTIGAKTNVGPLFNIHKITNMFAAYETEISKSININGTPHDTFKDYAKGENSRNQQSAILANLILDNAKWEFADAIGLNKHNISQAVLLTNLGVSLSDIGLILNSPAAKKWTELNNNNNSIFHSPMKKATMMKQLYAHFKMTRPKDADSLPLTRINTKEAAKIQTQPAIIELLSYLADMNSDVQQISTIMSGHNKIHVNPIVLEQQLEDYKDVLNGKGDNKTLKLSEAFKDNPDMKNYERVARETLKHLKKVAPVYRDSTMEVLKKLRDKIGGNMSTKQLEEFSRDIMKFHTSRLIGLNNSDRAYVDDLMNPESKKSIFRKLAKYTDALSRDLTKPNDKSIKQNFTGLHNSVLFAKALNMNLYGNKPYLSANPEFVNDSFDQTQRTAAQEEFAELPSELQNDLILYDMITRGWKGPYSMYALFSPESHDMINFSTKLDAAAKNNKINSKIKDRLENIVALKSSMSSNNPFQKIYVDPKYDVNDQATMVDLILADFNMTKKIEDGMPMYINLRSKNGKDSALYEMAPFSKDELISIANKRSRDAKRIRTLEIAKDKIAIVKNDLHANPDIDLALIADPKVTLGYKARNNRTSISEDLDPFVEATIRFEEMVKKGSSGLMGMDAREDFYIDMFTNQKELSFQQFDQAMEYNKLIGENVRKGEYEQYVKEKNKANNLSKEINAETLKKNTEEELLSMYTTYGEKDVYAYAGIVTPIILELTNRQMARQMGMHKDIKFDGKDINTFQAHMMSGSTIPSNHPASQAMARMLEVEYKNFINEKKNYIQEMNKITDALYDEKLGYSGSIKLTSFSGIKNFAKRLRDTFVTNRSKIYEQLYGNLVTREESINDQGKLVINYALRPQEEIESEFEKGYISQAEKDFYDYFKKTTGELKPKDMKAAVKENYIPHTSMTTMEAFSSRGLLGLLANSRNEDESINDVEMFYNNEEGERVLMNFSKITDLFKRDSAGSKKNDINTIVEYRRLKTKAKKLLKTGKNEDGSRIIITPVGIETALGFGAINRFANGRSVKATELPSMDLNKALGDYIHSSLFVNGNEKFQGMKKLQAYIDGVLAFNDSNNLPNMNQHVQKVWKDYFLKGKRQESFLGKKADKVIIGLTRLNLFYALGYQANKNTGGLYAIGNIMAGKYHNIKDVGGKEWIRGEARYWGLDKGFEGGLEGVIQRHKRMNRIMKNINFMEINIYDEVNIEKKNGLDAVFTDLALAPMILSERWIQRVHMIGLMSDEQLNRFDEDGNYHEMAMPIQSEELVQLEDRVKSSHGRGYQPTDQRAVQMYSWGTALMQFSRFIPTMIHDRFAKEDVNIYGKENIGTLRAVGKMVRNVVNDPEKFIEYRNSLSPEQRQKLDSGLKGMAMTAVISMITASADTEIGNELLMDTNYYMNYAKLESKLIPASIQSTNNLVSSLF